MIGVVIHKLEPSRLKKIISAEKILNLLNADYTDDADLHGFFGHIFNCLIAIDSSF